MRVALSLVMTTLAVAVVVDATPVSVCRDATYEIAAARGAICSGAGAAPTGNACPRKGDRSIESCHPYLPSFDGKSCVAKEDAVCEIVNGNTWGCVFPSVGCGKKSAPTPAPTVVELETQCPTWNYDGDDVIAASIFDNEPEDVAEGSGGTMVEYSWFIQEQEVVDLYSCNQKPTPKPSPSTSPPTASKPTMPASTTPAATTLTPPTPIAPRPTTPASSTPALTTRAPTTPTPTTPAPTTPSPLTSKPTTPAPTTPVPTTPVPTTPTPTTPTPPTTTPAPTTPTPTTPAPTTPAPTTPTPTTPVPTTPCPTPTTPTGQYPPTPPPLVTGKPGPPTPFPSNQSPQSAPPSTTPQQSAPVTVFPGNQSPQKIVQSALKSKPSALFPVKQFSQSASPSVTNADADADAESMESTVETKTLSASGPITSPQGTMSSFGLIGLVGLAVVVVGGIFTALKSVHRRRRDGFADAQDMVLTPA